MSLSTENSIATYRYNSKKLPNYLIPTDANRLLISSKAKEGKNGPFDVVFDYGRTREVLKAKVPTSERITQNRLRLEYLSFGDPRMTLVMDRITNINSNNKPEDDVVRFNYQNNLYQVFRPITKRVKELIQGETVFFPPLRGADLVRAFFQLEGFDINTENTVDYELKRVLLEQGNLLVGETFNKTLPKKVKFQTAIVIDDCIASDVSMSATVQTILEKYPDIKNIIIAVSAASQRGMESLQEESKNQNIDLHLIAAVPVFQMNDLFYLQRTKEEGYSEGTQYVGDMGKWAKKLPDSFNSNAPWNKLSIIML